MSQASEFSTNHKIGQLENVFFSALEVLLGAWSIQNASKALLSYLFYKRIQFMSELLEIDANRLNTFKWNTNLKLQVNDNQVQQEINRFSEALRALSLSQSLFNNIFEPFQEAIKNEQNENYLIQAFFILDTLDYSTDFIDISDFGDFFFQCLYRTICAQGQDGAKKTSPFSLNNLMHALTDLKGSELILDPAAGIGGSLIGLGKKNVNIDLFAYENDRTIWAFCKMNMILNGFQHAKIYPYDFLSNQGNSKVKFDRILSHLPTGYLYERTSEKDRKSSPDYFSPSKLQNYIDLFIRKSIECLNEDGFMIALIPFSILKDDETKKLRTFLIKNDLIEMILSLPYGLLSTSGIPVSIIKIKKQKNLSLKGKILVVNASNMPIGSVNQKKGMLNEEQIGQLKDICDMNVPFTDEKEQIYSDILSIHHCILNDYNLDIRKYASPMINELRLLEQQNALIPLLDLLNEESPTLWIDQDFHQHLPFIKFDDLGDSFSNFLLSPEVNESEEAKGSLLNHDALIIGKNDDQLKMSYFYYKGQDIILQEDLIKLNIDTNMVHIEYLILQLQDTLFKQQLLSYSNSDQLFVEDLKNIQIKYCNLDQQKEIVAQYKLNLLNSEEKKVEQLRADLNMGKMKAQNQQIKIFSSIHHELGNKLPSVLSELKTLKDFLLEHQGQKISIHDPLFEKLHPEEKVDTVEQLMKRMDKQLSQAINSINATAEIIKANRHKLRLEIVSVKEFLENIKENYLDEKFKLIIEVEEDAQGKPIPLNFSIDIHQMYILFSNLIRNAILHGFTNPLKKYIILFRVGLSSNKKHILIDYKNNGNPFPKDFSFEDYIEFGAYAGDTGHTGIGGYLIGQIIDNHNGTISLQKNIDKLDPFKVQFRISLPSK